MLRKVYISSMETGNTMTRTATGLIRVSTAGQAESGLGLAAQEASIREWCAANDVELVALHTEAGVSGRAELDKRAGLVEAIADARTNSSMFFIVAKMDRLSRDPLVSLTVEKSLCRAGIQVVSTSGEGTENNDASSVLMRRIMSAVAECEATMISARTSAAIQARLASGGRWGRAPLGFKVVDGELEATELAHLIHEAVKMSEAGVRQRPIMEFLTKYAPETTWSQPKVSRILKNWKNDENLRSLVSA
jgi:DNA invertase Pin-like site-specific DNA recombinase